jgi:hypothetical protein
MVCLLKWHKRNHKLWGKICELSSKWVHKILCKLAHDYKRAITNGKLPIEENRNTKQGCMEINIWSKRSNPDPCTPPKEKKLIRETIYSVFIGHMKEWMNGSKHSHHMHFPIHINDTNNVANKERLFTRWGMKNRIHFLWFLQIWVETMTENWDTNFGLSSWKIRLECSKFQYVICLKAPFHLNPKEP